MAGQETAPPRRDGDDPVNEPIINNPFEYPRYYRHIDGEGKLIPGKLDGRRPSGAYETVPRTRGGNGGSLFDTKEDEMPYSMINLIRDQVGRWRDAGRPGLSDTTRFLLEHWSNPEGSGSVPYFCQRDAVETAIYILETNEEEWGEVGKIRRKLEGINADKNSAVPRLALKMATATGKTWVIGMLALWNAFRTKGRVATLVIAPNLTVASRLEEDLGLKRRGNERDEDRERRLIYGRLLPGNMARPRWLDVMVVNYQKFQTKQRDYLESTKDSIGRKVLATAREGADPGKETYDEMMARILQEKSHVRSFMVINDEAHHCYQARTGGSKTKTESRRADMWFSILSSLHGHGRLDGVIDVSATPMYTKLPHDQDNLLFGWTVSDYPLIDAVEAGITKIPILPVDDDSEYDEPVYRNLFRTLKEMLGKVDLDHTAMNPTVKSLLRQLAKRYGDRRSKAGPDEPPPVMIVVADKITNAEALYRFIAGYRTEDGAFVKGAIPEFSNVRDDESGPVDSPPTLLVHSKIDEGLSDGKSREINRLQQTFFPKDEDDTDEDYMAHIRTIFGSVGRPGKPGSSIRCVISVSMLTEGWDVKTVSHILGFRAFESQLLCEQVAGRALRKTVPPSPFDGIPGEECAEIFGIPFNFMEKSETPRTVKKSPYNVRSVEENIRHRIRFPNISGYVYDVPEVVIDIDLENLETFTARPCKIPLRTEMAGVSGVMTYMTAAQDTSPNGVVYLIASRAARAFMTAEKRLPMSNALVFSSLVGCVRRSLESGRIRYDSIQQLGMEPNLESVAAHIAGACHKTSSKGGIRPVFPGPDQPRRLDTGSIDFDTTLRNRYPRRGHAKKSEISIAACHSAPEAVVAGILDRSPRVGSWMRNYRVGWFIPYFDPRHGMLRYYEPDFVATLAGDGDRHLILEYKGQAGSDSEMKREAVENYWIPAVHGSDDPSCAGIWTYRIIEAETDKVMIAREIDDALDELEGLRVG